MTQKKKISVNSGSYDKVFSNWLSQLSAMTMTKYFYLVAGRGSSKTTECIVNRVIEMMYEMPGAPVLWLASTYTDLLDNILPMVRDGLRRKGYNEGIDYVVGRQPPEYNHAEKRNLPEWLKPNFWKPFNTVQSYKNKLITFTGFNISFGSLDRPASFAGNSYVHVIGDESKYFKENLVSNAQKSLRGYRMKYGNCPFFNGHTFTTDMPDLNHSGEYDWILKRGKKMNTGGIMMLLRISFVLNECRTEYLAALESGNESRINTRRKVLEHWEARWRLARLSPEAQTFYYCASSYVNVDILTPEWFASAIEDEVGDLESAILSISPAVEQGLKFYPEVNQSHFYYDGSKSDIDNSFGLFDREDCRILKYLDIDKPLEAGVDFGTRMNSMSIYQENIKNNTIYFLKFIHTLAPEKLNDLAVKFLDYFRYHKNKNLVLYYDRSGNKQLDVGKTAAFEFKKHIEYYQFGVDFGKPTGWRVRLASLNQGNIGQEEEYYFMQTLFSQSNPRLPKILIDGYHCKPLKCSLENAKVKISFDKYGKKQINKDKSSEKYSVNRLLLESTNPSDSLKYGLMTKARRVIFRKRV
ncbi:MAG: hypothetical protein LBB53_01280 [Prevotellaceae bacterium]|jgi:hypothetical protein|nr:hypothetical protein [Prevotellaceae bacterium]